MRILLLTQFYQPIVGGEERHVQNLAAALVARGHTVNVATLWVPGTRDFEYDGMVGGVGVYRVRGTLQRMAGLFAEDERRHAPPFPDPELIYALGRLVSKLKPDVVHAHNWLLASYMPLKVWNGAALVVSLHDYSLVCPKKNLMYQGEVCTGPKLLKCLPCANEHYGSVKGVMTTFGTFAYGSFARQSVDRFIAVSHAVALHNRLVEYGVSYEVIPNFVPDDINILSDELDPCLNELPAEYILFVGDLMHLKGVDVLLNAYSTLDCAPPLVLIGRHCPDTPVTFPSNVQVFSMWPHRAIMHAWSRCLFGVLPSVGPEACATVVMEAMALGKPMIASDIGGMPDLVDDGT